MSRLVSWSRVAGVAPLALALLAGCAPDPAADKPAAVVADAAVPAPEAPGSVGGAPAAVASHALVAAESRVGFHASKVTRAHEGAFSGFTSTLDWAGRPEGSAVRFTVPLATVKTDSERLDRHLRSEDFFGVERFPEASFDSTAVAPAADGAPGRYDVTGTLSLHGVAKQVTFPATIAEEGDAVRGRSEFSIQRKDFGIVYPGKPDDLIRDDVVLKLDLLWRKAG